MVFLYVVLGWRYVTKGETAGRSIDDVSFPSAFVGLAVMLALMPVPAKVASLMGGVQERKMKAVSDCADATGPLSQSYMLDRCSCPTRH